MCRWKWRRCRSHTRRSGMACTRPRVPSAQPVRSLNTVSLDPPADTRACSARYRATWMRLRADAALPKLGLGRFIVVAPTDQDALRIARRAYAKWHASFTYLFRLHGRSQMHPRPADFDTLIARGQGVAGAPATVRQFLRAQLA